TSGADRRTTFVSVNKLTASISAADISVAGSVSITVLTPGTAASNGVSLSVRNPAPSLSAISPTRTLAAGTGLTLTVTGTHFVPGSVVRWKGAARDTIVVGATELRADIPTSDIATAGSASVTVFNPTPGGGTSAAATFTVDA